MNQTPTTPPADEATREASDRRVTLTIGTISAVYVVVRIIAAWGRTPLVYPDSAGYRPPAGGLSYSLVSLAGNAPRSWFVPLLYAAVPSDRAIVALQVGLSIAAWLALAISLASSLRRPAVQVGATVAVLALGATPQVATWDLSVLSESTSISLTVAAVAAWLRFATRRQWPMGALAVALSAGWLFSRPYLAPFALATAGVLLVWAVVEWQRSRPGGAEATASSPRRGGAVLVGLGVALILFSGWSLVVSSNVNEGYRLRDGRGVTYFAEAFGQNMFKRYLNDPEATAFFTDRGMPSTEGMTPSRYPGSFTDDYDEWLVFYSELQSRPEWMAWLEGPAQSAFVAYLRTHPTGTITDFLDAAPRLTRSPMLPVYGSQVAAIGSQLGSASFFFGDDDSLWYGDLTIWIAIATALAVAAAVLRRPPVWPVVIIGGLVLALASTLHALSWLGSAYETVRHAVPAVQLLRVAVVLLVAAFADAVLTIPAVPASRAQLSRPGSTR